MFDLSLTLALRRGQERIREELEGERRPGVALEVTGTRPLRILRDLGGGLRLKSALKLRKSRI
jgi:hypothetical protein